MRLHSLEISAFGPFAGTEVVDFDALGSDGLFLLHGRTGAGKTTVLDAVAFALYGTVPGARKDGKRLLSDHAPAGSVPKVTLEVTLGGRRIRIGRSPEYHRPKLRGTGTTKQNAKATLTWLDGRGQNLTRIDEIGDVIGSLLGMSADQFFQVVLLPQGEFARFLRADSDERGDLLERLFDTARFGDVEEWFATARKASADTLEMSTRAIDKLLGQISTAAGVAEELDRDPWEWASDVITAAKHQRVQADNLLAATEKEFGLAEEAVAEATARLARQKRSDVARAQLAEYAIGAQSRREAQAALEGSRAGGPIAKAFSTRGSAAAAADRAARALDDARRLLSVLPGSTQFDTQLAWPPTHATRTADKATTAEFVRGWTTLVAKLDDMRVLSGRADRAEVEVGTLRARHAEYLAAITTLQSAREALPASIATAEAQLAHALGRRAERPALESVVAAATEAVQAAIALAKARKKLAKVELAQSAARTAHLDARESLVDIRGQRLDGMAAELAAQLADGTACVVCGATEHPAPAAPHVSSVSKEDEEASAAREHDAALAFERAGAAVAPVLREIDGLVLHTGGGTAAELASALDAAVESLRAARAAEESVPVLQAHLARLRTEQDRSAAAIADVQSQLAAAAERIEIATVSIADMRAVVAAATAPGETIEHALARTESLISAASGLSDLRSRYVDARAVLSDADSSLRTLLENSAFETAENAIDAQISAERTTVIEAELKTADEARSHAERILAEPEIIAVAGTEPVDTEPLKVRAAEAAAVLRIAVAEAAGCRRRTEQLEELTGALWSTIDRTAPMRDRHDELAALADVVAGRGQNSRKMSLRSYVLASRLEEVAESASARLGRMSSGRYEFVHSDEAESRGRRGGLGLNIRDDHTGVIRSAKTLSGGESFLASLALALGLADVVAAEAGGVVLDTMFIDEGFGTLDADTLESVMGVLDELRAGGRVVGIVSHVDEMRQRIPSRLHVIRERTGSSIQVVAS